MESYTTIRMKRYLTKFGIPAASCRTTKGLPQARMSSVCSDSYFVLPEHTLCRVCLSGHYGKKCKLRRTEADEFARHRYLARQSKHRLIKKQRVSRWCASLPSCRPYIRHRDPEALQIITATRARSPEKRNESRSGSSVRERT